MPRFAGAQRHAIHLDTGITKALAEVMKASSAAFASSMLKLRSSTSICASRAKRSTAARVMPCRMSLDSARVTMQFPLTI